MLLLLALCALGRAGRDDDSSHSGGRAARNDDSSDSEEGINENTEEHTLEVIPGKKEGALWLIIKAQGLNSSPEPPIFESRP